VVIVAPRIPRDRGNRRIAPIHGIWTIRVVDRAERDDGPGRLQYGPHVRTPLGRAVEVLHLSRVPAVEPLAEKSKPREPARRGDPAEVESHRSRFTLDVRGGQTVALAESQHRLTIDYRPAFTLGLDEAGPTSSIGSGVQGLDDVRAASENRRR